MPTNWKKVDFAGFVTLSVPEDAEPSDVQGIDSQVAEWRSGTLTIRLDYGLYSDRLTSHANRPAYTEHDEELAAPARFVEFDGPDGSRIVAANFDLSDLGLAPRTLTVTVQAADAAHADAARQVIRSIEFRGSGPRR